MSHFSVIVVVPASQLAPGDPPPSPEDINNIITPMLQPYHEFECTGCDDQFVVEVDKTAEAREAFEKDTETMLRCPDGRLISAYSDEAEALVYRDPTPAEVERLGMKGRSIVGTGFGDGLSYASKDWGDGQGYRAKIREVPEGYSEEKVLSREVTSFADWACDYYGTAKLVEGDKPDFDNSSDNGGHKYGYVLVRRVSGRQVVLDETGAEEVIKVVDRTNPNKKWDWWQIGGRWSGKFLPEGSQGDPNTPAFAQSLPDGGNFIRRGDWDLEGAIAEATERYGRYYDDIQAAVAGTPPFKTFEQFREEIGVQERPADLPEDERFDPLGAVRDAYHAQPCVVAAKEVMRFDATDEEKADQFDGGKVLAGFFVNIEDWLTVPRDKFILSRAWGTVGSFAILDENGWHQKGEMGWFGSTFDEDADWPVKALELVRGLDEDDYLVCVDCHI